MKLAEELHVLQLLLSWLLLQTVPLSCMALSRICGMLLLSVYLLMCQRGARGQGYMYISYAAS